MKYKGKDILRLIPQRKPFVMVDELEQRDEQTAVTAVTVHKDNYFMMPDGTMATTGLIEHIAQSCSAFVGSKSTSQHAPVGMIAEVKNFTCSRQPNVGEKLVTTVTFGFTFGQMTLAHGLSAIGDETICEVDLKIFIQ